MISNLFKPLSEIMCLIFSMIALGIFFAFWENKCAALVQTRVGISKTWLYGFKFIADNIKLWLKNRTMSSYLNKIIFINYVIIIWITLIGLAIIPLGYSTILLNLDLGLLYLIIIKSFLIPFIILLSLMRWFKYALLEFLQIGLHRILLQIPIIIAITGIIMQTNSMNLSVIVNSQQGGINHWNCFNLSLLPLFGVYLATIVLEAKKIFIYDIFVPDKSYNFSVLSSELIFTLIELSRFCRIILNIGIIIVLFLGGGSSPWKNYLIWVPHAVWFVLKFIFMIILIIFLKTIIPKYRKEEILELCWHKFIPLGWISLLIKGLWLNFKKG